MASEPTLAPRVMLARSPTEMPVPTELPTPSSPAEEVKTIAPTATVSAPQPGDLEPL